MYFPTSSALIEFLILAVLEKGDSYGYEISQTIKLIANIKESTLYPILKKLEGNSFLTTYSREFQGRMRKYYSLTNGGIEQLVTLKDEWALYTDTINGIIEGSIRHDKNSISRNYLKLIASKPWTISENSLTMLESKERKNSLLVWELPKKRPTKFSQIFSIKKSMKHLLKRITDKFCISPC